MADFLRALAATQDVRAAARSVGMSRQSAYRLRTRLKGEPFDIAWEAAFQHAYDALAEAALERALHGVEVPVFHKPVLSACLGRQSKGASRSAPTAATTSG